MTGARSAIGVVIATKGRPTEAAGVVELLTQQTARPAAVVVVDSSPPDEHSQLSDKIAAMPQHVTDRISLVLSDRASQPHQKNLGVREVLADPEIQYVQFLDDDVSFEPNFLAACRDQLARGEYLGVCAATLADEAAGPDSSGHLFGRFFCLNPGKPGSVTRAGRNAGVFWSPEKERPVASQWLLGCAMYTREVLEAQSFWAEQDGYVLFEDVEFSVRVARIGHIAFLPWVRLDHRELSRSQPNHDRHGYQMIVNRYRVVTKTPYGSTWVFLWSSLGLLLRAGLGAALGRRDSKQRLRGLWRGLKTLSSGRCT